LLSRNRDNKGYVTNLAACPDGIPVTADFVIGSYHRLFEIGKSFRTAKSDLQARPIYHHLRGSHRRALHRQRGLIEAFEAVPADTFAHNGT
jgi:hypothetical protein